jgi:hypothetical protein
MVLEDQPSFCLWLVDELPKLQSCLDLCRFAEVLLQPGLQDGKHPFHWNGPENLITTLIPTDGILLEIHNQKERCHSWSLIATTSRVWIVSMLFYSKTRLARAIQYPFQVVAIRPGFGCVSNFDRIHSLLLVIIKLHPWELTFASAITWVCVLSFMSPSFSFWPIEWGCLWAHSKAPLCPQFPH